MDMARYFFRERTVRLPTLTTVLLAVLLMVAIAVISFRNAHRFLALNAPLECSKLVIEGWVPDFAFDAAIEEFEHRGYSKLYVTGQPLERGAPLSQFKNYAELGAAILAAKGFDREKLVATPAPPARTDRTYVSAMALRDRLIHRGETFDCVNVMTMGAHARRTRNMFQLALEPTTKVGVISVPEHAYDAKRWWATSAGFRTGMDESIAYIYAKFLFKPPQ